MRMLPVIAAVIILTLIGVLSSIFIVDERKQALVLQFGQVKQIKSEPGLGFKIPFIQEVAYYEGRILPMETSELEVTPADERRLVVDAFARWRITDVVEFRQAVQTEAAALLADVHQRQRRHDRRAQAFISPPIPCSAFQASSSGKK